MPAALVLSIHSREAVGCVHIYHMPPIKWERGRLGSATRTGVVECGVLVQPCVVQGSVLPRDEVKPVCTGWLVPYQGGHGTEAGWRLGRDGFGCIAFAKPQFPHL